MATPEKNIGPVEVSIQQVSDSKDPKDETILSTEPIADSVEATQSGFDELPWYFKWVAVACVFCFPIGANWASSTLGPLKNTLREELDVSNAQYGVIASAANFVNTVFPIVGGMALDYYGPNIITVLCTVFIFVASLVTSLSVGMNDWRLLTGGQIIMGFGTAVLKFYFHWFGAGGYATVFGLDNTVATTIGIIAGLTAIPIRNGTGWYGWSFWISTVFCGLSVFIVLLYIFLERAVVPKHLRLTPSRGLAVDSSREGGSGRRKFSWNTLAVLPWAYLMLPATQILQSGAGDGFESSSTDMIFQKGYEEQVAGFMSTAPDVIKIVLSPIIGILVDRYGHRFHLVATAPVFFILACVLMGFTNTNPIGALILNVIAKTINAMPLQICIPLLVKDQAKIGTAFGLWRAFNACGGTITEVAYGAIQDSTPGKGYSRVLLVNIGLKAWAFCLGIGYIVLDHKAFGKGMTMTRKQRTVAEERVVNPETDRLTKRSVKPWVTAATLGLLAAMIASSWSLFMVYLAA